MSNNTTSLNRLFTKDSILSLVRYKHSKLYHSVVTQYVANVDHLSHKDVIAKIYHYLSKSYRNEYFFKNTLFNKLLLGRHSVETTTALSQVTIEKAKADLIMINGKAVVYEIKSPLDNFSRLESQIENYYKSFDHVCILCPEIYYEKLAEIYQSLPVGIYVLSTRNTIQFKKEPQMNRDALNHHSFFKILRKGEYESILKQYLGYLPITAPAFYYDACLTEFSKIPLDEAYSMFLKELKKRNCVQDKDLFDKIPSELKSIVYFSDFQRGQMEKILEFIDSKY
ncbi:MAG: sce7726 family protein [Akkermansia sp.]